MKPTTPLLKQLISEFEKEFCDWNQPSKLVNTDIKSKLDFLSTRITEMIELSLGEMEEETYHSNNIRNQLRLQILQKWLGK